MRFLGRTVKIVLGLLVIVLLVFFLGPKVAPPNLDKSLPEVTSNLKELEQELLRRENAVPNIRLDNEARIIWADSVPQKTDYSIVYLHGWSASQEEGDPIHWETAKRFGCNLYLPRLAGHGLKEKEPMLDITADALIQSAKEAIAVGKRLGDKVILMATSTGGTLALHLAGDDPDIAALLLYSPNVEIYDPNAKLLSGHWGLQLAKAVKGSAYHEFDTEDPLKNKYWTTKYRLEALTQLQVLVEATMTHKNFTAVTQPVFLGYFYKNDSIQDNVVSVPAMLTMYDQLGTATNKKRKVAFPDAGDHVLASHVTSKDLESVSSATYQFLEEVLSLSKAPDAIVPEAIPPIPE
ncbi:MAG: alpha/beta hydrolase [Bacteroidota bacterium]